MATSVQYSGYSACPSMEPTVSRVLAPARSPGLEGHLPLFSPENILKMIPNCLRLFWHEARLAASLARARAGSRIAARMPIMAMTTSNSIRVKPLPSLFIQLMVASLCGVFRFRALGAPEVRIPDSKSKREGAPATGRPPRKHRIQLLPLHENRSKAASDEPAVRGSAAKDIPAETGAGARKTDARPNRLERHVSAHKGLGVGHGEGRIGLVL